MTSTMRCPACGGDRVEPAALIPRFPAILFPLDPDAAIAPTRDLDIRCCEDCRHLFQGNADPAFSSAIYLDFYYSYPFKSDEVLADAYRKPFEKAVDCLFAPGPRSLLEIGCSNEGQMRLFLERGYRCTAMDPSAAQGSGEVRFVQGFYGQDRFEGRFDYVVSRFNLEHAVDLDSFFGALKGNLLEDGLALIQVPNVEYFLSAGYLNAFAHEHTHYFSRRSLAACIERRGFEILYLSASEGCSLICCFRFDAGRERGYDPQAILRDDRIRVEKIQRWLAGQTGDVVFYGAGLTATALLYYNDWYGSGRALRLVDDNPAVQGRTMPNTAVSVARPARESIPPGSTVLLTLAPQYHARVLERLKSLDRSLKVFAPSAHGVRELEIG